ncbi:MAG: tripartite tricarboxylate transporter substrate binding protein [Burkholderiaceae bacterium]
MTVDRRSFMLASAASIGALQIQRAHAQGTNSWPDHTVRFIVPFPPGVAIDTLLRTISIRLTDIWKQPVIVENKPGAGANIGIDYVAHAPADGYTVLPTNSNFSANPALYSKVRYDPIKDFEPVGGLIKTPAVAMVPGNSPITSVADLVARAKAKPGSIKYASGGNGTLSHFTAEMFKAATGVDMLHVPYKGGPEMMTSLLSGTTDVAFPVVASMIPQFKAGKFRPLAITSEQRMPQLPDVPTLKEALPAGGFVLESENGLVVPAGTPQAIVQRMNQDIMRIMRDPAIANPLIEQGYEIVAGTPQALGANLRSDVNRYAELVKRIGLKLD